MLPLCSCATIWIGHSTYCSANYIALHMTLWCILYCNAYFIYDTYRAWYISVHITFQCTLHWSAYCIAMLITLLCILHYSAYYMTVHITLQCSLQCTMITSQCILQRILHCNACYKTAHYIRAKFKALWQQKMWQARVTWTAMAIIGCGA